LARYRRDAEPQASYVTIEREGEPYARVDAWPLHGGPFVECIVWQEYVVLGWGGSVHLIDPVARDTHNIDFEIYFGHLYPLVPKLTNWPGSARSGRRS